MDSAIAKKMRKTVAIDWVQHTYASKIRHWVNTLLKKSASLLDIDINNGTIIIWLKLMK